MKNEITLVYYADASDARRIRISTQRLALALATLVMLIAVPSLAAWHYAQQASASDAALAAISAGHCPDGNVVPIDDEDVGAGDDETDAALGTPKRSAAATPERKTVVGP